MWSRRLAAAAACALAAGAAAAQDAPPKPEEGKDPPPAAPPAETKTPEAKPAAPPREPFRGTADDLAQRFPAAVRVAEYGRSRGGAPLRVVTVSNAAEADVEWAALVVAHLSGLRPADESALALDVAARIAERAADLPPRTAVRVIADASPDAVGRAGNATPTDEDRDGDVDEDAPDDVDGDGRIGWMRFPDPAGNLAASDPAKPDAPPELADAAKGRRAAWRVVREGRDDDRDGAWNEDGPGGADVSRNFPVGFEEHVPLAGRWAVSEPETRALMDLLLADERIAVVYEFCAADVVAGNGDWGGAWPKLPDEDAKLLDGLRAAHGANEKRTAKAPGAGSLGATAWHQLGRLWLGRAPLQRVEPPWPETGARAATAAFAWKPVTGDGLPPGAEVAVEPAPATPPDVFAETVPVADFLLLLARERAQLAFTKTESSGEPGVLRLETRLANAGRLPTHTQRGAEVRGRRPLNVRIVLPDGATLLAGRPLEQVERLAGGAETDRFGWAVAGPSGAVVRVECTSPDVGRVVLERAIP